MGFLNAVYELGKQEERDTLSSFLKLPLPFEKTGKNNEHKKGGNEIRVHLRVENVNENPIKVLGVNSIDLVDFMSGEKDILKWKNKYLYRDPVGANTSWKFTPILKIGKPSKDENKRKATFIGEKGDWSKENKTHFYKIKNKMLMDYENSGYFTAGSVDRIMKGLEDEIDQIVDLFSENESHLIIFGVDVDEKFLYPGEIPAFKKYFKEKIDSQIGKGKTVKCSMCGKETASTVNLDKVFNFATFDKKSFLPALDKNSSSKVFPICTDCFAIFSNGRERLDREFMDMRTIPGMRIWCIPEIIGSDSSSSLKNVVNQFKEYVAKENTGIEDMFDSFAKFKNENLLFHFVFWEPNNAQEIVHLMIEDVPPTHLRMIEKCWRESLNAVGDNEKQKKLSRVLKFVYQTITSFGKDGGKKNKADLKVLRDFSIEIIGKLLNKEKINVESIKALFVQLIPKLLYSSEDNSGVKRDSEIKDMFLMIDFISRFNSEVRK
ncbi:TM1802 family CRISPR-associated protein [Mesoaciditoga lauensis]|uniref:TM1802 family CRISPR-associated protein n=1 Tax=Mesoaciditoga lauensis TaxID=1495039 RepID=UPI00055BEE32|nr:TM1802 family CRISPR-associated protein [Mesoaciditoga lauensis]